MKKSNVIRLVLVLSVVVLSVVQIFPLKDSFTLGIDLQGGTQITMAVDTAGLSEAEGIDAVDRATEVIRNRVDGMGFAGTSVQKLNNNRIAVQVPGIDTDQVRMVKELIRQQVRLEFRLVDKGPEELI